MRQIEKMMQKAIEEHKNMRNGNTAVINDETGTKVYLHGNCIWACFEGVARFTLAGWNTQTTRSRLNALGLGVRYKNGILVYNGKLIFPFGWYTV